MTATIIRTSTSQEPWQLGQVSGDRYFTQASGLSPPGAYAHSFALWPSALGGGSQRVVVAVPQSARNVIIKCFGSPQSANAADPGPGAPKMNMGIGALWAVSPGEGSTPEIVEYFGDFLGRFDITLRDQVVDGQSFLAGGSQPAAALSRRKTAVVDRAFLPGLRVNGEREEASPTLSFDALGCSHVVVELRCQTPALSAGTRFATDARPQAATQLGFLYRFA